jgi:hypothetical protein
VNSWSGSSEPKHCRSAFAPASSAASRAVRPPLKHANLNVLGRYSFRGSGPVGGALRPLRDPAEADEGEDKTAEN